MTAHERHSAPLKPATQDKITDMNEMADATDLSARSAWRTIQEASAYEEPLRRRTEGLTWMVWGLVTLAIFLSYDAISPHFHSFDHATGTETTSPWYIDILWVYWVIAGALLTWAVWRNVSLASPIAAHRPAGLKVTLLWVLTGAIGWTLVLLLLPGLHPHLTATLAIGLAWITLGVVNLQRATAVGRRVIAFTGFAILLLGLAAQTLAPEPGEDLFLLNIARMLAAGLPPFLGGLWQTLRG